MTVVLTEAQRRHFAVLAMMLEETLAEMEEIARGGSPEGRLVAHEHDLPADFPDAMAPVLERVRAVLGRLVDMLSLEARPISDARRMNALLITSVVRLEDSTSRKIRGYGVVHPSVARDLDPLLGDIHRDLAQLANRLEGAARP